MDADLGKRLEERSAVVGPLRLAHRVEVDPGLARKALVRRLVVVSPPERQGKVPYAGSGSISP
jgi:hypothetical protein